jgi:hypothetical protein
VGVTRGRTCLFSDAERPRRQRAPKLTDEQRQAKFERKAAERQRREEIARAATARREQEEFFELDEEEWEEEIDRLDREAAAERKHTLEVIAWAGSHWSNSPDAIYDGVKEVRLGC